MPQIEVVHPFTYTDKGEQKYYAPGTYDVDQSVADHWFTKAHIKQGDEMPTRKHPHEGDASPAGLVSEKPVTGQPEALPGKKPAASVSAVTGQPEAGVNERYAGSSKGNAGLLDNTLAADAGNTMPSSEELGADVKDSKDSGGSKSKKGL